MERTQSNAEDENDMKSFGIPQAAWKRPLDHKSHDPRPFSPTWSETFRLIGLGLRMMSFVSREKKAGRQPFMDPLNPIKAKDDKGVPCGGIGGGAITRGFKGDFVRWSLTPGRPDYVSPAHDFFAVFSRNEDPKNPTKTAAILTAGVPRGISGKHSTYYGLFPRAWTVHREPDPKLLIVSKQVSPVIPHNYQESSFPVTVFSYRVENRDSVSKTVSLMFSFQNGTGTANDTAGGHYNRSFHRDVAGVGKMTGVELRHKHRLYLPPDPKDPNRPRVMFQDPLTFGIAVLNVGGDDVTVTHRTLFECNDKTLHDGSSKLWKDFSSEGKLEGNDSAIPYSALGKAIGAAVCAQCVLKPGQSKEIVFALGWDMPVVRFGATGSAYYRRYTKFFGREGTNVQNIISSAFQQFSQWEAAIEKWQRPTLADVDLPLWYKTALFNELYYISDGGSIWTCGEETQAEHESRKISKNLIRRQNSAPRSPIADLEKEKKIALALIRAYLSLTDTDSLTQNGMVLYRAEATDRSTGRIVFSLAELPLNVTYVTEGGISLERINPDTILMNSRVYVKEDPGSAAPTPRTSNQSQSQTQPPSASASSAARSSPSLAVVVEPITKTSNNSSSPSASSARSSKDDDSSSYYAVPHTGHAPIHHTHHPHAVPLLPTYPGSPSQLDNRRATLLSEEFGQFAYLESHEYLMYNTYDVHFYASFALIMLWPALELSLQRDIARASLVQYPEKWGIIGSGELGYRKLRGAVPHDLGCPHEDPWKKVNIYNVQDVSNWKDLNSKFVLQIYRDFVATGDEEFLHDNWEVVKELMHYLSLFDRDRDGMIENEGFPDQTYDAWSVRGASAYCGGLWIAALSATVQMAEIVGERKAAEYYKETLLKAQTIYESKLWNGKYYRYDASNSSHSQSIMADQLAGQWYVRACGLEPIHPTANIQSALKTVFDNNVMKFKGGQTGALNGMSPHGHPDTTSLQSCEVWAGTSYALAACMLQEGLVQEAFQTARGVYKATYEGAYAFQTPEAWDLQGDFRAIAYMRPLSIWAMKWAWDKKNYEARLVKRRARASFEVKRTERKLRQLDPSRDARKQEKLRRRVQVARSLLEQWERAAEGTDETSQTSVTDDNTSESERSQSEQQPQRLSQGGKPLAAAPTTPNRLSAHLPAPSPAPAQTQTTPTAPVPIVAPVPAHPLASPVANAAQAPFAAAGSPIPPPSAEGH